MNYEQKYKEALQRAKKLQKTCDSQAVVGWCEHIFPELKESEDGRIRKNLIELFHDTVSNDEIFSDYGLDKTEVLAWLEKQGQEPRKVSIWKHWENGIAGNGEGESIYLVKYGNTYSLNSCLSFECDYIELSELDSLMLEKQGEQKPSWSKEDELIISKIKNVLNAQEYYDGATGIKMNLYKDALNWLKSIRQRIGG